MSCWDLLGIEPTRHRSEIDEAFEVQRKFISGDGDDGGALEEAYHQALREVGFSDQTLAPQHDDSADAAKHQFPSEPDDRRSLDAKEQQVARETVIQIRALLNDNYRTKDVQVWKAILAEPPSDQPAIRQQIGQALEKEVRPMAKNGAFPADVVHFLADWFGWHSLRDAKPPSVFDEPRQRSADTVGDEENFEQKPQSVNFWPAAIGWIVGLVILTSLFSSMGGGG